MIGIRLRLVESDCLKDGWSGAVARRGLMRRWGGWHPGPARFRIAGSGPMVVNSSVSTRQLLLTQHIPRPGSPVTLVYCRTEARGPFIISGWIAKVLPGIFWPQGAICFIRRSASRSLLTSAHPAPLIPLTLTSHRSFSIKEICTTSAARSLVRMAKPFGAFPSLDRVRGRRGPASRFWPALE